MEDRDLDAVKRAFPNPLGNEPSYLPTIFPISFTVGFGYTPSEIGTLKIPQCTLKSVLTFILKYLEHGNTDPNHIFPQGYLDYCNDADDNFFLSSQETISLIVQLPSLP